MDSNEEFSVYRYLLTLSLKFTKMFTNINLKKDMLNVYLIGLNTSLFPNI